MDLILKQATWDEIVVNLKENYPQLKETDFKHKIGKEKIMLRMVAYKLHKTKLEMQEIIARL